MSMVPVIVVTSINIFFLIFGYFIVFPIFVKTNSFKLALYDFVLSIIAVSVSGMYYYDSGVVFHVLGIETNWLIFAIISYAFFEIAFFLGYRLRFFGRIL